MVASVAPPSGATNRTADHFQPAQPPPDFEIPHSA